MTMTPVKSTNVAAIGYDPARRELGVQYHSSDTVYTHPNVSAEQHKALMDAPSKGAHLAAHFRKRPSV